MLGNFSYPLFVNIFLDWIVDLILSSLPFVSSLCYTMC
jgi:hypothetical protein